MTAATGRRRWTPTPWPAAYPIYGADGTPAWQGVVVVEPADYRWRCPHTHYDHDEAVGCARQHDPAGQATKAGRS